MMEVPALPPLLFVLAGGLAAGTLDIVFACTFWRLRSKVPALRVFQSVATGLLGRASFAGGARTVALGLALHYVIATTMCTAYYVAARHWSVLWQQPLVYGTGYGLLLYVVMNLVVVPLSAAPPPSRDPLWITLSILAHVLLVGIPIAIFAWMAFVAT